MSARLLLAAGIAALAGAAPVGAMSSAQQKRPRPSDVPRSQVVTEQAPNGLSVFNDYATPERKFESARTVVHYVVVGIDAPPLNDDDGDDVPDYVERVGAAADESIAYFERRGFTAIRPDDGGLDARPDLYVSRFAPGYLGVALPACDAEGGAFVAIANNLDPSAGRSFASLYATVAHEIFHLVQFSYFAAGAAPPLADWVLEGSAAAMESRVYPDMDDLATAIQLRGWLAASGRSFLGESYAAQLLWRYLDVRSPRLVGSYLARLAAGRRQDDAAALVSEYARVTGQPFASVFGAFALAIAGQHAGELTPRSILMPHARYRSVVDRFSIHYLRLRVPREAGYLLTVELPPGSAGVRVALAYELEDERSGEPPMPRRLVPRVSDAGRTATFTIPRLVRRSPRFTYPTLVVSNGAARGAVAYSVTVR